MDFTLSTGDHTSVNMYSSLTGDKPRSGDFWSEVGKPTTLDGRPRFPFYMQVQLIVDLSTMPVSNADSERGFLVLRKIHTDHHATPKQSTIISLMAKNSTVKSLALNQSLVVNSLLQCTWKKTTTASLNHHTESQSFFNVPLSLRKLRVIKMYDQGHGKVWF